MCDGSQSPHFGPGAGALRARDGVEATLVLFRRHADRDALGFGVSDPPKSMVAIFAFLESKLERMAPPVPFSHGALSWSLSPNLSSTAEIASTMAVKS